MWFSFTDRTESIEIENAKSEIEFCYGKHFSYFRSSRTIFYCQQQAEQMILTDRLRLHNDRLYRQ